MPRKSIYVNLSSKTAEPFTDCASYEATRKPDDHNTLKIYINPHNPDFPGCFVDNPLDPPTRPARRLYSPSLWEAGNSIEPAHRTWSTTIKWPGNTRADSTRTVDSPSRVVVRHVAALVPLSLTTVRKINIIEIIKLRTEKGHRSEENTSELQ